MRRLPFLAVALFALTACSNLLSAGTVPATGGAPRISSLAAGAGCTVVTRVPSLYATEEGTCGNYVFVTFSSPHSLSAWLQAAKAADGPYLVGTNWVAKGRTRHEMETLREALGGQIQG